jgi:hypothetical protein
MCGKKPACFVQPAAVQRVDVLLTLRMERCLSLTTRALAEFHSCISMLTCTHTTGLHTHTHTHTHTRAHAETPVPSPLQLLQEVDQGVPRHLILLPGRYSLLLLRLLLLLLLLLLP